MKDNYHEYVAQKDTVAAQRRASYIESRERGAMARVKARWNTAEGQTTPCLVSLVKQTVREVVSDIAGEK